MAEVPAPGAQQLESLSGTSVGRFVVHERLGEGGMGEVYRADDSKLMRSVALKRMAPQLRSDPHYRRRFLKEAERASSFSDPHIAALYDILEQGDELFLVMEFVEGRNLRQRLRESTDLRDFLEIAVQSAESLAVAHSRSVLHCDIKPENIMITLSGAVKVLDFGVAQRIAHPGTDGERLVAVSTVSFGGTTGYMAPEVILEQPPGPPADIFSLGVVFYEALAGFHPFFRPSFFETCDRILHVEPPPLEEINGTPPELARIVRRMLEKDAAQRYQNAKEIVEDLKKIPPSDTLLLPSATTPSGTAPLGAPTIAGDRFLGSRTRPAAKSPAWRKRGLLASAAVLAIAVTLVSTLGLPPRARRWANALMGVKATQLAVLPFSSEDATTTAFSAGLAEAITARLGQQQESNLQVVPPSELRNQKADTVEKARQQFGVDMALTGSIHAAGNLMRVTYSLVDARTRQQVRGDTITAAVDDPFALEDQVVQSLLRSLRLEPPRETKTHGTVDPAAYTYYLSGRGYLQDYTKTENLKSAVDAFKQALGRDPNYAMAYAALGETYWHQYFELRDSSQIANASMACQRALAIDTNLAQAHACLGTVYSDTGKYDDAIKEFKQAVAREPKYDDAIRGLAQAYERNNNFADAETTYRHAIEVRPSYWANYNWLGTFFLRRARYEESAAMFQKVIALAPDNYRGYNNLGGVYIFQGRYKDAIAMFQHSVAIRPSATAFANLGTSYFHLRQFSDAVRAYNEAVRLNDRDYAFWGNLADAQYWAPDLRPKAVDSYRTAITLAEAKLKINPRDPTLLMSLAVFHAMLDEKEPAMQALAQAQALGDQGPETLLKTAIIYAKFGDREQTLAQLEKWFAAGGSPAYARAWPDFDPLASDPHYQALLKSAEAVQVH